MYDSKAHGLKRLLGTRPLVSSSLRADPGWKELRQLAKVMLGAELGRPNKYQVQDLLLTFIILLDRQETSKTWFAFRTTSVVCLVSYVFAGGSAVVTEQALWLAADEVILLACLLLRLSNFWLPLGKPRAIKFSNTSSGKSHICQQSRQDQYPR